MHAFLRVLLVLLVLQKPTLAVAKTKAGHHAALQHSSQHTSLRAGASTKNGQGMLRVVETPETSTGNPPRKWVEPYHIHQFSTGFLKWLSQKPRKDPHINNEISARTGYIKGTEPLFCQKRKHLGATGGSRRVQNSAQDAVQYHDLLFVLEINADRAGWENGIKMLKRVAQAKGETYTPKYNTFEEHFKATRTDCVEFLRKQFMKEYPSGTVPDPPAPEGARLQAEIMEVQRPVQCLQPMEPTDGYEGTKKEHPEKITNGIVNGFADLMAMAKGGERMDLTLSHALFDERDREWAFRTENAPVSQIQNRPVKYGVGSWTRCATEGSRCSCVGAVRYGDGDAWKYRAASGSIACTNAVFGDPKPGTTKKCECISVGWYAPYNCDQSTCSTPKALRDGLDGSDFNAGEINAYSDDRPNFCCAPDASDMNACVRPKCIDWACYKDAASYGGKRHCKAFNRCRKSEICVVVRRPGAKFGVHECVARQSSAIQSDKSIKCASHGGRNKKLCLEAKWQTCQAATAALNSGRTINGYTHETPGGSCKKGDELRICTRGPEDFEFILQTYRNKHDQDPGSCRGNGPRCRNGKMLRDVSVFDNVPKKNEWRTSRWSTRKYYHPGCALDTKREFVRNSDEFRFTTAGRCQRLCSQYPNGAFLEKCYASVPGQCEGMEFSHYDGLCQGPIVATECADVRAGTIKWPDFEDQFNSLGLSRDARNAHSYHMNVPASRLPNSQSV